MDLDWLKDFLALAEHGNFSRAADLRNVTQPAFSRRIRALEDWVGTQLFTRSVQGAGLTPAGTSFLPRAADLLRQLEEARRETSAVGARRASSISTAATHVLSFTFFPGWIRQLGSSRSSAACRPGARRGRGVDRPAGSRSPSNLRHVRAAQLPGCHTKDAGR